MTEKLYYIDSHMKAFTATVTSCEQNDDRFEVTLDRTAFFPEGGGQFGDSGVIGGVRVFDNRFRLALSPGNDRISGVRIVRGIWPVWENPAWRR